MKYIFLLIALQSFLFSQKLSHSLHGGSIHQFAAGSDTLNILAVMVQFQPDNDSRSSGNGQFDLGAASEKIIDAPPHDSAYFADHFIFAQNYFRKASNGKQFINATVLGTVVTLSKQMREYAPLNNNLPLANMIEETWKKIDSLYPGFSFSNYDMFVVFHAGVGKDVDLRASLGYDPTPYDLPSLYFNLNAFRNVFGTSFDGIAVQNSAFKITNTAVLPETEVRKIPSVGGDFTLKLGMNGLLVASIASHLGLPDLFDTETGRTAIGRFGLMDGQSIFSFSGICPPEPSAWEKVYMGWSTPIEVYGNRTLSAPAVSFYETGNDTIYKIPISAKEYFLVENRQRDAHANGSTVTMKWNGHIITKTFSRDESYYSNTNIDSIYGVVLDVDELDWSLPGIINANNNYHGGILIWHIDETIIDKNLAANTINANPLRRGVDVEEADGSQDIGQSYELTSPGAGSEDGSPIDYWFNENISPVYKNIFSETSNPNSLSNTLAQSHITLKNFSTSSSRMTFEAQVGSAHIQLLKVIKRNNVKFDNNDAPTTADLNGDGNDELVFTSGDSIYVLTDSLKPFLNNPTGLFSPIGGRFQPTILPFVNNPGNQRNLVGIHQNSIIVFHNTDGNNNGLADTLFALTTAQEITTPATTYIINSGTALAQSHIIVGDKTGKRINPYMLTAGTWNVDSTQELYQQLIGVSTVANKFAYSSDTLSRDATKIGFGGKKIKAFTAGNFSNLIVLFDDNSFAQVSLSNPNIITYRNIPTTVTSSFALSDINGDSKLDILVGGGNKFFALNDNGVMIENFPITIPDGGSVVGSPIVVKLTGSNEIAILFGSTNGQLYAYTSKGKMIDGFPLQTDGIVSSPVLWEDKLVVASSDTSVYVWKTGNLFDTSQVLWGNFLADKNHTNHLNDAGVFTPKSSELLPKSLAYNWPNPVYGSTTNIRYYLGQPASVTIKIVNMAGELVDQLQGTNYVGMDNEVIWDVTNTQSGIYFAHITASGNGGVQRQIIKIAVVK